MEKMREKIDKNNFDEYDIMQNAVLGAHCIYETIKKYEEQKENGMMIPICYFILPILYNNNFSSRVKNMNFKLSSFYKSIYKSEFNYLNVLDHADILFKTTSHSLLIAEQSGLVSFDNKSNSFNAVIRVNIPIKDRVEGTDYSSIISSAKRLGSWFGQVKDEQILNIFKS